MSNRIFTYSVVIKTIVLLNGSLVPNCKTSNLEIFRPFFEPKKEMDSQQKLHSSGKWKYLNVKIEKSNSNSWGELYDASRPAQVSSKQLRNNAQARREEREEGQRKRSLAEPEARIQDHPHAYCVSLFLLLLCVWSEFFPSQQSRNQISKDGNKCKPSHSRSEYSARHLPTRINGDVRLFRQHQQTC